MDLMDLINGIYEVSACNAYTILIVVCVLILVKRLVDGPKFKMPQIDLSSKVAVVTGGCGGIGFEVVK